MYITLFLNTTTVTVVGVAAGGGDVSYCEAGTVEAAAAGIDGC